MQGASARTFRDPLRDVGRWRKQGQSRRQILASLPGTSPQMVQLAREADEALQREREQR